jgi:putative sigma-54 modulation protein
MRITVKGNSDLNLDESILDYIQNKIGRVEKFYNNIQEADLVISELRGKSTTEITIKAEGKIIRAESQAQNIKASIDKLSDKIETQMKKYKERLKDKSRKEKQEERVLVPEDKTRELNFHIEREKRFTITPLTDEEALDQMELLGHDFFIYYRLNNGKERMAVIYRRRNGGYGILLPEIK